MINVKMSLSTLTVKAK
ncbi:unnamed protein product, partial [Rotaria sordida]